MLMIFKNLTLTLISISFKQAYPAARVKKMKEQPMPINAVDVDANNINTIPQGGYPNMKRPRLHFLVFKTSLLSVSE